MRLESDVSHVEPRSSDVHHDQQLLISPTILFAVAAASYWVGSRAAFELADLSGLAAVFFIPAGITLALLVRTPKHLWWVVLTAAGLVEFGNDLNSGLSVGSSMGFVAANVAEPLVGATLLLRWARADSGLARRRSVAAFLVAAVGIGPLVGAVVGATTAYAADTGPWRMTMWQWWLGDALGVLVVGGFLLAWSSSETRQLGQSWWRFSALLGLSVAMPFVTSGLSDVPLEFVTSSLIIVAGGFFGVRGATTAAAVGSLSIAVVLGIEDSQVWMGVSDATAWATIKAQFGVASIAGLVLAAEVYERQSHAETIARSSAVSESAAFTRRVLDQLISFVTVLTPGGTVLDTNHAPLRADGSSDTDIVGRQVWECPWWQHDSYVQEQLFDAVELAAGGGVAVLDVPMEIDGSEVWVEVQISPLRNRDGTITHLIKSCTDLTERRETQQRLVETANAEREARKRVELLARTAANLTSAITVDIIADAVLGEVKTALGLELGYLYVVGGSGIDVHAAPKDDGTRWWDEVPTVDIDTQLPGPAAIAANSTLVLNSIAEIAEGFPGAVEVSNQSSVSSMAAFPVRSDRHDATAALVVGAVEPGWFTPDRVDLLESIATQTGQAIRRAHLHQQVVASRDHEHAIAVRLQDALLPDQLAQTPSLDVAARYLAAAESLTVGGDWYDTFTWPDGSVGLMVGDVVGHDLEAAATMGRLRAALGALVPLGPADPISVLHALDACANGPDGADFVTAACVVIDVATQRVSYATAGHPPPLIVRPDGTIEWLDQAVSPPAGRYSVGERAHGEAAFPPGSTVVLYTDGLIERRGAAINEGLEFLGDAAASLSEQSISTSQRWVDGLLSRIARGIVDDDVAVLAARFIPNEDVFRFEFESNSARLRDLRHELASWFDEHEIDEAARNDALLAIGEATTNAIEHAFAHAAAGAVTVEVTPHSDRLIARVSDTGTFKKPTSNPNRGRGTMIMKAISTQFERETNAEGTTVTMHLPVVGE